MMMRSVTNEMALPPAASPLSAECVTCASLPKIWQRWARAALPDSGENRDMAVERLQDCLARCSPWLDLSDLQLTALPDRFPDFLQELNLNHNRLTRLPETLPNTIKVLAVSNNQLTVLPEVLPNSLDILHVDHNALTQIPDNLAEFISVLEISYNQLTTLPDALPDSLDVLYASHNQLRCLPESLPEFITVLDIAHNQLTVLPDTLPDSLDILQASHNQLTRLPNRLPEFMGILYVDHNQLRCLPDQLPNLTELHARNNQLTYLPAALPASLETLQIANNPLQQPYDNVLNSFSSLNLAAGALCSEENQTLSGFLAKIRCWCNDIDTPVWERIYTEEYAEIFADFLYKLYQGKNSKNDALRHLIVGWLAYLAKEQHSELRKKTFILAQEATESCVDKASFYFNHMYIMMVEQQLLDNDAPLTKVVEAIRGTFRLQVIERLAAEKATARRRVSPHFDEDVEIYLAYQCALRESLSLPVYTDVQFAYIAGITEEDSCQAREAVIMAEKTDFGRYWLTESALWTAKLVSWNPEKKAAADHQYLETISADSFKEAVNKALTDKGIPAGDSDAQRILSQALAADLLYQQRYQLTQEYLADHQALFLMEQCHLFSLPGN